MHPIPEPPNDKQAEAAMLGAMFIDKHSIPDVLAVCAPSDCYDPRHAVILEHVQRLHAKRTPVDYVTLVNALTEAGKLEFVGGTGYLASLARAVPSAMQAVSYAEIVANAATRRRLLDVATSISRLAYSETDGTAALSGAESLLYQVQAKRRETLEHISGPVQAVTEEFNAIANGEIPTALPTGYSALNGVLDGWRRQELTVIAARPGIGKTALLCNVATKAAQSGHGVAIFSAEMSAKMLVKRMIRAAGVHNLPGVVALKDVDWDSAFRELAKIGELPLWIDDTPSPTVTDIRSKALRLSYDTRIEIIAVDYIQLLRTPHNENRYLEIGTITKALKNLAREMDNHVIAAAQLSRNAESAKPTLADLKESGAQEEDADNVILLHRAREIPAGTKVMKVDAIVAKQRNGPTGTAHLGWYPERVCFVSLDKTTGIMEA